MKIRLVIYFILSLIMIGFAFFEINQEPVVYTPVIDIMKEEDFIEVEKTVTIPKGLLSSAPVDHEMTEYKDGKIYRGFIPLVSEVVDEDANTIIATYRGRIFVEETEDGF